MRRGLATVTACSALALALALAGCNGGGGKPAAYPLDDTLRVHEIQLLTTHNSYHLRSDFELPPVFKDPLQYEHVPLDQQLDIQGVRGFELDVVNTGDDFPVVHTPVVDAETNCTPFRECLRVVKEWSDDHAGHAPIFILVEAKDGSLELGLDPTLAVFDAAALGRLDDEIRSVFSPDDLLTPDDVRGDAPTLREAVQDRGWPTLGKARGRIVLILNDGSDARDAYLTGRPSLEGAPMFVTAAEAAPSAAVIKVDDPDEARIQRLVRENFVVRTRADADVVDARVNDVTRRDLAFRTGAQIVSTDFPVPDPVINAEYSVQIPGGRPGRCNPVQAPKNCRSVDVENPEHLERRR